MVMTFKLRLGAASAFLLSATALAGTPSPWPSSFKTPQLRLDYAPGAMTVSVQSGGDLGVDFREVDLAGSPNVDPMNGLPWRPMPSFELQLLWGADSHHDTAEQCALMAEQVSLLPPTSAHRFRVELEMQTGGTMTVDNTNLVNVGTNNLWHLTCTIL
jgi:hypothetical protein